MGSSQPIGPEEIYRNWLAGESGCERCERRDEDRVATPYFGYGDLPANVVFLGEAPGGTATGEDNALATDKRVWKNHREVAAEAGEAEPAELSDFTPELDGLGDSHHNQLEPFFVAIQRELEAINVSQSLYYTNVAKCNDIWDRSGENRCHELNANGKQRCRDAYLISELKAADPRSIILFSKGSTHITETLKTLGVSSSMVPSASSVTPYVFNFDYEHGSSPFRSYYSPLLETQIIVSYHYKQGYTQTTDEIKEGNISADDIGRPDHDYGSTATTPRPRYADAVATKVRELLTVP